MLGSLTSLTGQGALTGGHAGPSNASNSTNAAFEGGSIQFGNTGVPYWIVALIALVGLYVWIKK